MILSNSRTLLEDLNAAKKAGYKEEYYFRDNKLINRASNSEYFSHECFYVESAIHESLSDPSDQSIVFLIQTKDKQAGCLVSSYGTYANSELIEFVMSLEKLDWAVLFGRVR